MIDGSIREGLAFYQEAKPFWRNKNMKEGAECRPHLKVEVRLALASFDRDLFWLKSPVPPLLPAGRPEGYSKHLPAGIPLFRTYPPWEPSPAGALFFYRGGTGKAVIERRGKEKQDGRVTTAG